MPGCFFPSVVAKVLDAVLESVGSAVGGEPTQVWSQDYVRQFPQFAVPGERFFAEDVQSRANTAFLQLIDEGILVDQFAPGYVDEYRIHRELLEKIGVDDAPGLFGQGTEDHEKIAGAIESFQGLCGFNLPRSHLLGIDKWIPRHAGRIVGLKEVEELPGNGTESVEAHFASEEASFRRMVETPGPILPHGMLMESEVAQAGKAERHGAFGYVAGNRLPPIADFEAADNEFARDTVLYGSRKIAQVGNGKGTVVGNGEGRGAPGCDDNLGPMDLDLFRERLGRSCTGIDEMKRPGEVQLFLEVVLREKRVPLPLVQ